MIKTTSLVVDNAKSVSATSTSATTQQSIVSTFIKLGRNMPQHITWELMQEYIEMVTTVKTVKP